MAENLPPRNCTLFTVPSQTSKSCSLIFCLFSPIQFSSLQSLSPVQIFATPRTEACQASLSIIDSRSRWTQVHRVSDAIQPSHPLSWLSLLLLPSVFPGIRVFSSESALCIRWPNYWNFSFSISPSSDYSGLISIRIDRLYFLSIQGNCMSLLQYHN